MLRLRVLARLALVLWSVVLAMGCGSLSSRGLGFFGWTDPLQETIFKQSQLENMNGCWRKDPAAVLKEVPLGTSLEQARSIMSRHGFRCEEQAGEENDSFLLCVASRNKSWMMADVIKVRLYHQAGKVSAVEIYTYFDAP